ncbi:MAG: hypothetical protein A2V85_10780 [Chloroflexi bacterium RBG_16_72_14]|nr:MAG: hypothetical protein A2V85_10780 [Chloroflexi bacterium RBG_16_72_14]
MIAVAVVMTLLGTRLTGVSPRMAAWSPTLPSGLARRLGLHGDGGPGYSDSRAVVLGGASFFLPCGFTQAVQIYALSTGSPLFAGAIMAVFALGTAPGLLALAGLPAVLPDRARPTLLRLVGVAVVGFALLNGGAGLRLAAATFPQGASPVMAVVAPDPTPAPAPPTPTAAIPTATGALSGPAVQPRPTGTPRPEPTLPGVQELATYQDVDGYGPADATILAGIPTRWTIESRSSQTCAAYLIVPDLEIGLYLLEGEPNVIELPPLKPGTLEYTCSMGMFWASISIVDPAAGTTDAGG